MSSQLAVRQENMKVLAFLRRRADSKGVIRENQQALAESYGCTHTLLHRHLHRLIDAQRVKVLSKGAQGKLVLLVV